MTQQDVADAIGTTKSAVSRIESVHERMPSVATLLKYADAVDCELEIRFIPRDSKPASRVVAEPRKSKPRPDSKV
jgi:transcriptional regulator with XRE-family HTH domain